MSVRQGSSIIAGIIPIDNTPTSSSTNAVSSGGVYTALSGKADTDLSNLTTTGLSKLGPVAVYTVKGNIYNSTVSAASGVGEAWVALFPNGQAIIEYTVKFTAAGSGSDFSYGLNRDILRSINPNIPVITPTGGTCYFYNSSDGSMNRDLNGYAGRLSVSGQFWLPGRVYNTAGDVGAWPSGSMIANYVMFGTAYGTYTV